MKKIKLKHVELWALNFVEQELQTQQGYGPRELMHFSYSILKAALAEAVKETEEMSTYQKRQLFLYASKISEFFTLKEIVQFCDDMIERAIKKVKEGNKAKKEVI